MVNLFINVYIYLGTRWHNHTGSLTEFWRYARLFLWIFWILAETYISIAEALSQHFKGTVIGSYNKLNFDEGVPYTPNHAGGNDFRTFNRGCQEKSATSILTQATL